MDDVRVTAVCPASRLTATLELLHAAILDAALTEATVTYARTRRTTWLDTLFATDPSRQALFRHEVLLWGATSPYGMEFEDTAADARSVTLDQVQKALTLLRDPKRTVIAIAGGYDDATLPRLVEGAFGSMAAASLAPAPVPNASIPRASRQVVLLDRSGAVTARIRVGASSAPINETDGFALLVLSQIVGSLDYGRLQARLRRELHLTDKVGSERFAGRMGDGFVLTAEVPTSAAGQTLHEIELLAKALIEHDVGADELGAAKERLVAEEAGSFERVRDVAGVMLSVNAIGLDPDTRFQTYAAKLAAIGSGDIRRVAERFLAPSAWKVVVIGDAATIRPELVRVGYPPDAR
jgi:predicted Zn-dependent peptidase